MPFKPLLTKAEPRRSNEADDCEKEAFLSPAYETVSWKHEGLILFIISQRRHWNNGIFPTDLEDARGAIEYEETLYTGQLFYDAEKNNVYRSKNSDIEYFGPPTEAVDRAWSDVLRDEFPPMTEEEAKPFLPDLQKLPDGKYRFEPAMFHSLHCLNAIRLELAKTLYPNVTIVNHHKLPIESEGWDIEHLEHCMDQLRQVIICHGDLAPSPLYMFKGFPLAIGKMGPHTCRKWQPIRDWLDERSEPDREKRRQKLKHAQQETHINH